MRTHVISTSSIKETNLSPWLQLRLRSSLLHLVFHIHRALKADTSSNAALSLSAQFRGMAQLLPTLHMRTTCSLKCQSSFSTNVLLPSTFHYEKKPQLFHHRNRSSQRLVTRSIETESDGKLSDGGREEDALVRDGADESSGSSSHGDDEYPSGEFVYREHDFWKNLVVKSRMLIAWPWQRVKKGSVLTMKLRGEVRYWFCFLCFHVFAFQLGYCVYCSRLAWTLVYSYFDYSVWQNWRISLCFFSDIGSTEKPFFLRIIFTSNLWEFYKSSLWSSHFWYISPNRTIELRVGEGWRNSPTYHRLQEIR